ncbi:MAG: mannose-1-phosphate guanylyltransferase [Deltaproteobacteria bacterium]|nr:mannose-1-phosphate guanylyltransferase [Deltaproteobacteria bacterium]
MFAVIMCGGSGTRFWPASRRQRPKQFLNITGKGPMVVDTCDRLASLIADERVILILGKDHREEAGALFKGRNVHILAEPVGRNTAPCMGLGALYARHLGSEEPVAFLPADHFISRPEAFLADLESAGKLAANGGIVTLGIVPTRPETGYGYIRKTTDTAGSDAASAYRVSAFVEKPDLEKAHAYLNSGDYYWNAGIFVATPETILTEIEKQLPGLHEGLEQIALSLGTDRFETEFKRAYESIDGISFDYGIMENTQQPVYVIPSECGWSDVGSWESLYALRGAERDSDWNLAEGETLLIDCEKSFISSQGDRFVVCLGLKNCLVVDTGDAVLVADMDQSQNIRKIVDQLKEKKKDALL